MAQGNTLVTKLKDALKALNEAPASMQRENSIKEAKRALTLAIQELGTTPGPSPVPTN
jgi:hypothetical protein